MSSVSFRASVLLLTGWAMAVLAPPEATGQRISATVDSTESIISYTGSATLHDWTGTSRRATGTLVLDPETPDSSRAVIRAPVASFDSGIDGRDENMREIMEVEKYPNVTFRTTDIRPRRWGATSDGHAGAWEVTGDLTFHGQTHPVEAQVDVRITEDSVRARARFPVSLSRFDVERPELMWVAPIADTIRIDARVKGKGTTAQLQASDLTYERSEMTGTRRIASGDLRDIAASRYDGRSARLRAEVEVPSEGEPEWMLAVYGFTDESTGLASASRAEVQAGPQSITPERVEGTTRTLDDGTSVEIVRMYLSRSSFAAVARALTVDVAVGPARFAAGWQSRRDLRLMLDAMDAPGQLSAYDEEQ